MWGLDYSTLKVGDEVGIYRCGTWRNHSEGIYTVVKANKLKVLVQRNSDGYERVFSVKRQCEFSSTDRYRGAFLETVADQKSREAKLKAEQEVRAAWDKAAESAARKDISALRQAVADLELLVDTQ